MNKPAKLTAASYSAVLSLLFVVVYGSTNWIAAHRGDVGTWYYAWERYIPFVPLMIVPYMSIDLFFVAAPFVCGSRAELRMLARRITFTILVAGIFFLAIPLKMAVPRPQVAGWTGAVFNVLHGFDQPYNLFPSLHIALRTILAELYGRHTKGALRFASHVWFSLIGFSTLLTYQHHFVDIVGGFILAAICFYVIREKREPGAVIPNRKVGAYYGIGACSCAAIAVIAWPRTAFLLWPASSLAIAAAGYSRLGSSIYGKVDGRLPLGTRLVMAPVLAGQYLSLLHYRRTCAKWSKVSPNLWIGAKLNEREAADAVSAGVTAVLDLTAEFSEPKSFRGVAYRNIPVLDLTELTATQLREAVNFISRRALSGVVYVHCKAGYSRSAAAVGAYLLSSGVAANVEEALEILRRVRPGIVLRPEVSLALKKFHAKLETNSSRSAKPLLAVQA